MIHLMAVEPRRPHHHNGYPGIGEIQSFGAQPFQQSSAQANANAFSNQFGSNGFGSNAANGNFKLSLLKRFFYTTAYTNVISFKLVPNHSTAVGLWGILEQQLATVKVKVLILTTAPL